MIMMGMTGMAVPAGCIGLGTCNMNISISGCELLTALMNMTCMRERRACEVGMLSFFLHSNVRPSSSLEPTCRPQLASESDLMLAPLPEAPVAGPLGCGLVETRLIMQMLIQTCGMQLLGDFGESRARLLLMMCTRGLTDLRDSSKG